MFLKNCPIIDEKIFRLDDIKKQIHKIKKVVLEDGTLISFNTVQDYPPSHYIEDEGG